MTRMNLDVPPAEHISTDSQAKELLQLALRKVEEDPEDFIGFDTESHAKRIPLGKKGDEVLDWMSDTVTFWSLSFRLSGVARRWCLDARHLRDFTPLLENNRARLATWNGKYDAHICWNSGVNIWEADTLDFQVCGQMLNENIEPGGMSLKKVALRGFNSEWQAAREYTAKKEAEEKIGPGASYDRKSWEQFYQEPEDPWVPIHMTPFAALFTLDNNGNKAVEYETSLYDLPLGLVSNYASLDAYVTLALAEHIKTVMADHDMSAYSGYNNLWEYFITFEKFLTEVMWKMERRGIPIDIDALEAKIAPMRAEQKEIQIHINRFAEKPINLRSGHQLCWLLYDKCGLEPIAWTQGGSREKIPKTDEKTLTKLSIHHDIPEKIVRYKKLETFVSRFMERLVFLARWYEDGRIHPGIKQFGAVTGRTSTVNPNSQNFPRPDGDEWGVRACFIASEGMILIVCDYGQLEIRIMAHFSGDVDMISAIKEGKDLHCFAVEKMYGIPYEVVKAAKDKTEDKVNKVAWEDLTELEQDCLKKRQICKNTGFAIFYGAGAPRISAMLKIPLADAQRILDLYFKAFPGVKSFMTRTVSKCRNDPTKLHFVTTLLGRRRNLPQIDSYDWGVKAEAEREAVNSVIQGSAADITKAAMLQCENDERLNHLGAQLINQIHDELVFECPIDTAETARGIIVDLMEHPFCQGVDPLVVKTPVSSKIVERWSEAK